MTNDLSTVLLFLSFEEMSHSYLKCLRQLNFVTCQSELLLVCAAPGVKEKFHSQKNVIHIISFAH